MRRILVKIMPVFLALLLVLVLCFSVDAQTTTPTPSAPAILSISLSVSQPATPLATPNPNTTYADVKVSIQVSGITLVDKTGQPNTSGEGHIIYYLTEPSTFPLLKAYTAAGTYFPSASTTFTRSNFNYTRGSYWVFAAQLVNNDDTPFNPPVLAEIVTNLPLPGQTATQPSISSFSISTQPAGTPPVSPVPNVTYMDVTISTQSAGLAITPWTGDTLPENVTGQGHYMYYWYVDPLTAPNWYAYLDDTYSYYRTNPSLTFTNAYAGYKSFSIQLVTNDNSPLIPPVYAIIKSNLKPGLGIPPTISTSSPRPSTTTLPPASFPSNGGVP